MSETILFILASIGSTHIVVDGAIFAPIRDWMKRTLPTKLSSIVDCYLCAGFYMGCLSGFCAFSHISLQQIFACGCAGGFLANFAAVVLNWLESATIVNLPDQLND